MSSLSENGALRISSPRDEAGKLERHLARLYGSPHEEPFYWHYFAHTYVDSRDRGALTLQLRSTQSDDIFVNQLAQDAVRGALWDALDEMVSKEEMPEITFEEFKGTSHARFPFHREEPFGLINLIFTSSEAFEIARQKLKEIEIQGQGLKRRLYIVSETSTLAGRIFIFDCLTLPLEGIDVEALFASMLHITKGLGKLLGLSKVVIESNDSDLKSSTTVRAYLKLSRPWLAVPLRELVDKLSTRLLWHGRPHRLLYVGHDLRSKQIDSADYPLQGKGQEEPEVKSSSEESDEEDATTALRNRRKRNRRA